MEVLQEKKLTCYHCNDDCIDEQIQYDEKFFCCYGCKAVYELINSSDLQQYYDNRELRATRVTDRLEVERKFGFLDIPEVGKSLIRYQDEVKTLVRFYISGIHCSSCIYLLEHLPKLDSRVLRSEVNFVRKEVSITYDHHTITLKDLAVLLSGLGYPPTVHLDSLDQSKKRVSTSSVGMKIAVAGFCFGNSMLISLPEYLDVGFQLEDQFKSLFGWINLLLVLPVVGYAASDYFVSSWKGLRSRYLNIDVPISLGILTLFSRSLLEILTQTGPGYVDSLTGLVFFLLVGKWYQGKTYEALSFDRDYTSYFPISVIRLHGAEEETVMIKTLKKGDEIIIHNQELVPADGVIIRGTGNLDYSFVTGEAQPVQRDSGEQVFAGGRQVGGELVVRLSKAVNNSELTQLWNNQSFSGKDQNKYHTLIDRVSKYFTITIILLALGTGIYWGVADPDKVWNAVTAVLIIACPCALALTLPFAFGHSMRVLGAKGIYLKNANVIELIARIKEIVFDKTGTLTRNDPMKIRFCGKPLTDHERSLIKTVVANSAHPLSKLVSGHLGAGIPKLPVSGFDEVIGEGVIAEVASSELKIGSASFLNVSAKRALHESQVHVIIAGEYRGYFAISADYREGIFEKLRELRSSYKLHLLSGDNATEQPHLQPYFHRLAFHQRPEQKLEYVKSLSERSLMIGDGLNDAGALKSADVGFAVCEDIHQFSPACDVMIAAAAVHRIPQILRFARAVIRVVIVAFILSFTYNVIGLSFAVTGNLTPVISAILMPVSSVTVVGFITLAVNGLGVKILQK